MSQPPNGQPSPPPDTPAAGTPGHHPDASLPVLFWIFFQIGALSFGGGLAAWVHREVVLKRGWMSETEFLTGLALCQVLPGVNVVNLAVHIGQRLRGAVGALACTIAIVVVPFFAVIGLATVYDQIKDIEWIHDFLDGVAVSAVGLLVSVALRSVRGTFKNIAPYVAAIALIVLVGILRWPMIPVVLCVAPLSVLAAWFTRARPVGGR
jgi:chromate transporter